MDNLTLGLGASGVGGVVMLIVGWIIAKGIHSRCIAGGNVIELDVHRATPAELSKPQESSHTASVDTSDSVAVEIATPVATHPPLHPIRTPKEKRTPKVSKTPV